MEQAFEKTEEEYILLGYYLGRQKLLNCVALQHLVKAFLDAFAKPTHQDSRKVVPPEKGCCLCWEKAAIFKKFWTRYRKRANVKEDLTEKDADNAWSDIIQLWTDVETRRRRDELHTNSIMRFEQAAQGILKKHKVKIYSNIKANLNERSNLLKWVTLIEKVKSNLEYCRSSLLKLCAPYHEVTRKSEPYEIESSLMTTSMTLVLKKDGIVDLKEIQNCRNTGTFVKLLQKPHAVDIKCLMCANCLRWDSLNDFSSMMTVLSKFQVDLGTKKSILNTHKKMVLNLINKSPQLDQNPQSSQTGKVNSPISTISSPKGLNKKQEYYQIISQKSNNKSSGINFASSVLASKTVNVQTKKTDNVKVTRILIPRSKPVDKKRGATDQAENSANSRTTDRVSESTTFRLIKLTLDNSQPKVVSQGTQNPIRISQGTQSTFNSTMSSDCATANKCELMPIRPRSNRLQGNYLELVEKTSHNKDLEVDQQSLMVPTCPAELFHFADSHFSIENESLIICCSDRMKNQSNTTNILRLKNGRPKMSKDAKFSLKKDCLDRNIHGPFSFVQSLTDIEAVLTKNKNPSFYFVHESSLKTKSSGTSKDAQKIGPIFLDEVDALLLKSLLFYKDSTSTDEFVGLYQTFEKRIVESISRFASTLPDVEKDQLEKDPAPKDKAKKVISECFVKLDKKLEKSSVTTQDAATLDEEWPVCVKSIATVTAEHIVSFIQILEKKCQDDAHEISGWEETSSVKCKSNFLLNSDKVETEELKTRCFKKCSCSKFTESESNIDVYARKLKLDEIEKWMPKCLSERTKSLLQNVLDCESELLKLLEEYSLAQKTERNKNIKKGASNNSFTCGSITKKQNFLASIAIAPQENSQTSLELINTTANVSSSASSVDEAPDCEIQQAESTLDFSTNCGNTDCDFPLPCHLRAKYRKNDQGVWSVVQRTDTPENADKASMISQYQESKKQLLLLKRRKALVKLALVDALETPAKLASTTENASKNFIFNSFHYQSYLDPHSTVVYSHPSHYTNYPDVFNTLIAKNTDNLISDILQKPLEEESTEYDYRSFSFSRKDSSFQSYGKNMFSEGGQPIRGKVISRKRSNCKKTALVRRKPQASVKEYSTAIPAHPASGESRKRRCLSYTKQASANKAARYTKAEFVQTLLSKEVYFALSALCLSTAFLDSSQSTEKRHSAPIRIVEDASVEGSLTDALNDSQQCEDSGSYHFELSDFTSPSLDATSANSTDIYKRKCKAEANFGNSDSSKSMNDLLPELHKLDDILVKIENVEDDRTKFWCQDDPDTHTENDETTDSENDESTENSCINDVIILRKHGKNQDRLNSSKIKYSPPTFTDIFMYLKAGMKKTLPKSVEIHELDTNIIKQFQKQKCHASDCLSKLLSSGYRLDRKMTTSSLHRKKKKCRNGHRCDKKGESNFAEKKKKVDKPLKRKRDNDTNYIGSNEGSDVGSSGYCSASSTPSKSLQNSKISTKQDIALSSAENTTAVGKRKKRRNELEYLLEGVHNANKHTKRNKNEGNESRRSMYQLASAAGENHAKQFPEGRFSVRSFTHKYPLLTNAYVPLVRCSEGVTSKRKLGQ